MYATFYNANEINNRVTSEIPHPFVIESMELFSGMSSEDKSKVHFIHLNHTNPLWDKGSVVYKKVIDAGFKVAKYGEVF